MSAAPHMYRQLGLRFRSEVPLALSEAGGSEWDVDVRWGPPCDEPAAEPPGKVIAAYESGGVRWYIATENTDGYRLRFRECGEFFITPDLAHIEVRPAPSGRTELLPVLLAGTASALLVTLRGRAVLHASAVAVEDRALAFVGQSGRGKSTLAALMCLDGADLVTDDVLLVEPEPPAKCVGGGPELRLRASAASLVETLPDAAAVTRATADERLAFAPRLNGRDQLPLGAIIVPAPSRTVEQVEVRRVPPSEAIFVLLQFPRIHGWQDPAVLTREFSAMSQLAASVPVYDVTIPWGPPFAAHVTPALRELVASEVQTLT